MARPKRDGPDEQNTDDTARMNAQDFPGNVVAPGDAAHSAVDRSSLAVSVALYVIGDGPTEDQAIHLATTRLAHSFSRIEVIAPPERCEHYARLLGASHRLRVTSFETPFHSPLAGWKQAFSTSSRRGTGA